ncbi:MAG: hypothetical protein K2J70_01175, partial [Muribaculaceae bacterium]|nr:hypothetical protein [Muribaculaceae bacterium]
MKRLSKDERIGALSLIIVSLLICGGSLLLRHRRQTSGDYGRNSELVRTIILARDSVPTDSVAATPKK